MMLGQNTLDDAWLTFVARSTTDDLVGRGGGKIVALANELLAERLAVFLSCKSPAPTCRCHKMMKVASNGIRDSIVWSMLD